VTEHVHEAKPRALALVLLIVLFVMACEVVGGLWSRSLALLADAGHMATDATSVGLSLLAWWASRRPADSARTFGYHRLEVLAALANGLLLWLVIGAILREAFVRIGRPEPVNASLMLIVASLGLIANMLSIWLLKEHGEHDINVRGAYLHVLADTMGSVGALMAALVILATGWLYADSFMSIAICGVMGWSSWVLIKESIHILLEGAPIHLDLEMIRSSLLDLEHVTEVHDLHLWSLTSGKESMTGHLVVRDGADTQSVLRSGADMLKSRFGLDHVTLQIEGPRDHEHETPSCK
jgi:cobalt-zinc-cadmium efflux system protein